MLILLCCSEIRMVRLFDETFNNMNISPLTEMIPLILPKDSKSVTLTGTASKSFNDLPARITFMIDEVPSKVIAPSNGKIRVLSDEEFVVEIESHSVEWLIITIIYVIIVTYQYLRYLRCINTKLDH